MLAAPLPEICTGIKIPTNPAVWYCQILGAKALKTGNLTDVVHGCYRSHFDMCVRRTSPNSGSLRLAIQIHDSSLSVRLKLQLPAILCVYRGAHILTLNSGTEFSGLGIAKNGDCNRQCTG